MRLLTKTLMILAAALMCSCGESKIEEDIPDVPNSGGTEEQKPSSSSYNEKYRPQIHYTPAKNWINDPNGLVYADGVYHMFYQYNPYGNRWGNMHWAHSSSKDLVNWTNHSVVIEPDSLGTIFSGSAVVDKYNDAGFGENAVIAFYTSEKHGVPQVQSMAYSTDNGNTFTKYEGNPVVFLESKIFNVPMEMVTKEQRSNAKAVNFGIVYGISEFSLADDIGVSRYEAKEYIDNYLSNYHGVRDYMKNVVVVLALGSHRNHTEEEKIALINEACVRLGDLLNHSEQTRCFKQIVFSMLAETMFDTLPDPNDPEETIEVPEIVVTCVKK